MKLICLRSPGHESFYRDWFLPSWKNDYELVSHACPGPAEGGDFLDKNWRDAVRFKSETILNHMEENPDSCFVYSDVDLFFIRPTRPAVEAALGRYDIACHLDHPGGGLCTGFIAFRATPAVRRLWASVHRSVLHQGRDQLEFNRYLRAQSEISYGMLPLEFFGTGTFRGSMWNPGECFHVLPDAALFHANWTRNTEHKTLLLRQVRQVFDGGPDAIAANNRKLTRADRAKVERARTTAAHFEAKRAAAYHSAHSTRPDKVRLDASTACQLKCPGCPTAAGQIKERLGGGFLRIAEFERFLERNPSVREVELSNWGEVFLNPDLPAILRTAHERGIGLAIHNGANLNKATPEALEAVVRYRLRVLSCSLDGATQETYATYRVNGNLERVLGHIRTINALKKKYRSYFPRLRWQFIAFGHNQHEIPQARAMAAELGMEFFVKLSWADLYGSEFSPVHDPDTLRSETRSGASSRREYEERFGRGYLDEACHQMWLSPQINTDGRVLGCTINHEADYGNAFTDSLDAVLAGEKMARARGMLLGVEDAHADIPCSTCKVYLGRKSRNDWVDPRNLLPRARPRPVSVLRLIVQRLQRWITPPVG